MEDFSKKFNTGKQVSLTAAQKQRVKANLLQFMQGHPREARPGFRQIVVGILALRSFQVVLTALVFMIVIGGTIGYAAADALPGSFLYPIKVHVNEEVRAALIFNPTAKTEYAMKRAELRLQESEQLQSQGKLDEAKQAQIQAQFQAQAEAAEQGIVDIENRGNDDEAAQLSDSFIQTLKVHQKVLLEDSKDRHADTAALEGSVSRRLESISKVRILQKSRKLEKDNNRGGNNTDQDKYNNGSNQNGNKSRGKDGRLRSGSGNANASANGVTNSNANADVNINVNGNSNSDASVKVEDRWGPRENIDIVPANLSTPPNTEIRVHLGL